mmetsp:Transcript_18638/g.53751  ORF Transcript_18638/g.53751 Transcript_18638/m.53751 type:complete len:792 (-) Transcript_18638:61-2436(-)|eukprot:CAMPEP_0113552298 /NCGR_PEP_ID=MMETSP0015_2-20120614/14992_1 /TAXON_ID=2838 /ORGANISM="Odontella" /LENGTH=791 /DNA_ID=CAMNT_0000453265 /DNA_START=190 /DNA_END=2565 /DNA_ORIENTATION=+ /assembly_acc=CAM_ASM_000160
MSMTNSPNPPASSVSKSTQPWAIVPNRNPKLCTASLKHPNSAKKKNLAQNKFFVPHSVEIDLHTQFQARQPAGENSGGGDMSLKESLRCFKRNQRRKRQRAQKRAALDAATKKAESKETKAAGKPSSPVEGDTRLLLLFLPHDVCANFLSFLCPADLLSFGGCSKRSLGLSEGKQLWRHIYYAQCPGGKLLSGSTARGEWKLVYQIESTKQIERLVCPYTKTTFFDDIFGYGVDFTVNPKTQCADYIHVSQDLLSKKAFVNQKVRSDIFGRNFKLFLPLFFSKEHFKKALPQLKRTIVQLCPQLRTQAFDPLMVLEVFPKIVNTVIVLVSDEGLSASQKSFYSLLRMHRLLLAFAELYPEIKTEALRRLRQFSLKEENRTKKACPSLGNILPVMMIVDETDFSWRDMCLPYLSELFDRAALWICKAHPKLERTVGAAGQPESDTAAEERIILSREAMAVSTRLTMFHVYFLRACCKGTTKARSSAHDIYFRRPDSDAVLKTSNDGQIDAGANGEAGTLQDATACLGLYLSFEHFNSQISEILAVNTWQQFFNLSSARCPKTKAMMAQLLRQSVKNSRRKGYHKVGMDFSRIQASGTSKLLTKGQTYSASTALRRVRFHDDWTFNGDAEYLDATCLIFRGRNLSDTIDYQNRVLHQHHPHRRNAVNDVLVVHHSGDVMQVDGGTHTIEIDLDALDNEVTSCVFVVSAWNGAQLADITSASISFVDADENSGVAPLCVYNLDAQDKIPHLTSVIMCKLYRSRNGGWHVLAIGDAHQGHAGDYGPIYSAVGRLL